MSSIDQAYAELGERILNEGLLREGRNGNTLSLFGTQLRHDLADGFPLLNMRRIFYKGVVGEFKSFIEDAKTLAEFEANGCPFWKLWADKDGNLALDYPPRKQLDYVINLIKTEPASRRIIIDLWNPDNIGKLSLECCHTQYQFSVRDGRLNMIWTQRSVDYAIGAPSDFILAALYTITIANECGLAPGELIFNFGDTHLYEEHINAFRFMIHTVDDNTLGGLVSRCRRNKKISYSLDAGVKDFKLDSLDIQGYEPDDVVKFLLKG